MKRELDTADRKIVELLQEDGFRSKVLQTR